MSTIAHRHQRRDSRVNYIVLLPKRVTAGSAPEYEARLPTSARETLGVQYAIRLQMSAQRSRAVAHEKKNKARSFVLHKKKMQHSGKASVPRPLSPSEDSQGWRESLRTRPPLRVAEAGGLLYHGRNERTAYLLSGADARRTRRDTRGRTEPIALTCAWRRGHRYEGVASVLQEGSTYVYT